MLLFISINQSKQIRIIVPCDGGESEALNGKNFRKTEKRCLTDLCPCGETQPMSHDVESCPFTKLNGGLSQLHCADDAAIAWLSNYGS